MSSSDPAPAEEFVYERADGTVETALNAADAIARCPVLGKMPVEQANVLLELAAIGREKMEAEAVETEVISRAEQKPEPEPLEVSTSILTTAPSGIEIIAVMDEQAPTEELDTDRYSGLLREQTEQPEQTEQTEQQTDQPVEPPINRRTAEPVPKVETEKDADQLPAPVPATAQYKITHINNPISEVHVPEIERPIIEVAAKVADDHAPVAEAPKTVEMEVSASLPIPEASTPVVAELAAVDESEGGEVVLDEEVIEIFEQLIVLIEPEREDEPLIAPDLYETAAEDEINLLGLELAEAIQANKINVFEEFVAAQDPPETIPDIEEIITEADDRPLEETLVQLSYYLAESAAEPTDERRQINTVLKELAESLPTDREPAITPEVTQKLLILLRAVGYDNPREVLVGFVERNDFEFLIQAVRHLHQLSDTANQKEQLPAKPAGFTVTDVSESLTTRIGRAIMRRFFSQDTAILPA